MFTYSSGPLRHTRIGLVAVGNCDVTIITRISKYDGSNGAVVLSILDLEPAEQATVLDQSNLALDLNAELDESLKVINGATASIC